jgi:hypothetical protein
MEGRLCSFETRADPLLLLLYFYDSAAAAEDPIVE